MTTKVVMPKLSMTMHVATMTRWLKKEGEPVEKGEPLVEVETEKITNEIVAPRGGILARIVAAEGVEVPPGDVVAIIAEPGEEVPASEVAAHLPGQEAPVIAVPALGEMEPRLLASPAVRRLAKKQGVELEQVVGTGLGGRVTEADILRVVQEREKAPPRKEVPFTGMRRTIAERMAASLQTTAQVTLFTEADATELVRLRERLRGDFDLTYTDLIVLATVRALEQHPRLNASLEDGRIVLHGAIHIGVAVALDDGLIVPVIRNANRKLLPDIAAETRALATRARAGDLRADEVTGATFSITNLGMYRIEGFTPIINPPEAAILGVGRIVEKPVIHDGTITARQMLVLSLTFDHRIVDGAPASAFLQTVAEILETPHLLTEEG